MEQNKPSRNNPNPIPFIKIKNEPRHLVSPAPISKDRFVNKELSDLILLNLIRNRKLSNQPNRIKFVMKQETSASHIQNNNSSIEPSTTANDRHEETPVENNLLETAFHLGKRVEIIEIENKSLTQETNSVQSNKIKQEEDEREHFVNEIFRLKEENESLKKQLTKADSIQIQLMESNVALKRVIHFFF